MKFGVAITLSLFIAGIFIDASYAQSVVALEAPEPPMPLAAPPGELPQELLLPQGQPAPPPPQASQAKDRLAEARALEDLYRTEIKSLAQKKGQFVHCELKNGKVITGSLHAPGYEAFTVKTEALGDGTIVNYKDLAESPRAVPAVGTRIKQGAQLAGFVTFVVIFFIPLAIMGVVPDC